MSHLGSRLSALVDGRLPPAALERALAHVADCPVCAAELRAARAAREALAQARDVEPAPDLTARLLGLACAPPADRSTALGRRSAEGPAPRDPIADRVVGGRRLPGHALRGEVGRRGRPGRAVVGSLAGAGVLAAGLFALGARPPVVPWDHPGEALDLLAHVPAAGSTSGAPGVAAGTVAGAVPAGTVVRAGLGLPAGGTSGATSGATTDLATSTAWLRAHDWSVPAELPEGWAVAGWRWSGASDEVLVVDLVGPGGATAVLVEQQGVLDLAALTGVAQEDLGGRPVHVLTDEPLHAVWQSGDCVVQLVAPSADVAAELVAAVPARAFDDGVAARLTRGWSTVTAVLDAP
ncbi:zf-HC2 domain-containing protein [Cellulomonas marina]|uniref:Putative zinc-finger n=1 Tax=Cellulomonas marina TaxID=988821 RepID=A0A1I0ZI61_9CELL|nr:zf-HC2 domain-containing protein [Cellulomonas marina]GIG28618.1 hypothetical protein Cma02nite_12180 [Cellulomonas marina]SFB25469.1 Putative zinc-finger [Cellulomonas marina]